MTIVTAICQECKKQFDYDLKPGFPRKYCPACSELKKAQFAAKPQPAQPQIQQYPQEVVPVVKIPEQKVITEPNISIVLTRAEKPHSYEFGKPSARHKIYYSNVEELEKHIAALKAVGLCDEAQEIPQEPY